MKRVADPLTLMGARIKTADKGCPPIEIEGGRLTPIRYEMPVASAQVKSAILLAGLFADGETAVVEKLPTRDHTEIALEQMGADVGRHQRTIAVRGRARLEGKKLYVPGDISSAAFFIVAGLITPDSNLMLHNVGLNPTRTALLDLLVPMGGRVKVVNLEILNGELLGDLHVDSSQLGGGEIPEELVPGLIDELPVLSVLGTQTEQGLTFRGAAELRVKESDRLAAVAENLRRMGAEVEEFPDGLRVAGRQKLRGAEIDPHDDHRIAMAFAIAALVAEGITVIKNSSCVDISFPDFFETLQRVAGRTRIRLSSPLAILSQKSYANYMTLEAIKQAIIDLPEVEKTSLVAWLNEQDAKAWDKQIEADFSEGGAGMALLESWDAEIRNGRSVPLGEFLAQRETAHKTE